MNITVKSETWNIPSRVSTYWCDSVSRKPWRTFMMWGHPSLLDQEAGWDRHISKLFLGSELKEAGSTRGGLLHLVTCCYFFSRYGTSNKEISSNHQPQVIPNKTKPLFGRSKFALRSEWCALSGKWCTIRLIGGARELQIFQGGAVPGTWLRVVCDLW